MTQIWVFYGFLGITSFVMWMAAVAALIVLAVMQRRGLYVIAGLLAAVGAAWGLDYAISGAINVNEFMPGIVWLVAVGALIAAVVLTLRWWLGVLCVVVLVGVLAGQVYLSSVSRVPIDYSEVNASLQAKAEAQRRARYEARLKEAPDLQFAEDTEADRLDKAGMTKAQQEDLAGDAPETGPDLVVIDRSYRNRPTEARPEDAKVELKEFEGIRPEQIAAGDVDGFALERKRHRAMVRAAWWNAFGARVAGAFLLVMALLDYLLRFNQTRPRLLTLPLAGRWIDDLFGAPKRRTIDCRSIGRGELGRLLLRFVRKGERFIYLGTEAIWREVNPPRGHEVLSTRDALINHAEELDALWFGDRCVSMHRDAAAFSFLRGFAEELRLRADGRAAARRTINIVWAFDRPLPDALFNEIRFLCRETNCRLLLAGPQSATADQVAQAEETLGSAAGDRGQPSPGPGGAGQRTVTAT